MWTLSSTEARKESGHLTVAISSDDLRVYTSSTPSRAMLDELRVMRPDWRFVDASLGVMSLPLPSDRRLFRVPHTVVKLGLSVSGLDPDRLVRPKRADVFVRFNPGTFGPAGRPLISLVADLSAARLGELSSLRRYARIMNAASLKATIHSAARIVCISEFTRKDLIALYPESELRSVVIHNGLAPEWFAEGVSVRRPQPGARRSYYWIWYGQITPRKNVERLIHAYARVLREHHDASVVPNLLLVARFLSSERIIRNIVREHGLEDRVEFREPVPLLDLVELVKNSAGVVFPSLFEGFGMPVAEGLAVGVPVLTSNTTAMPEIAGGHAVLVDPWDTGSIERGLIELLHPSQWSDGRRASRRAWAERFTVRRSAEAYAALIEEVVSEERRSTDPWSR
ncbi:MAG: glycosyltransferase family 1 protein [Geminicoccaceae bacterium]